MDTSEKNFAAGIEASLLRELLSSAPGVHGAVCFYCKPTACFITGLYFPTCLPAHRRG